jgi:hypothetical protein
MKFQCFSCSKSFGGSGLLVTLNGEKRTYCAECLWTLRKEYDQKKTCETCGYFDADSCGKTSTSLEPVKIGINTYFVQAEKCKDYTTEKIETHKTSQNKKKEKEATSPNVSANDLVKKLAEKGQTITYYCCHCGTPLKIGAKSLEIKKTCPRCNRDLEVINLSKLIKQHT